MKFCATVAARAALALTLGIALPTTGAIASSLVTNDDHCLALQKQFDWPQVKLRACIAGLNSSQSTNLKTSACSKDTCIYRLSPEGSGVYRGSGYSLRLGFDPVDSMLRAALTDPQGASSALSQGCGAGGCPGQPEWESGAHRGVTYTAIGNPMKPTAIVLSVPTRP